MKPDSAAIASPVVIDGFAFDEAELGLNRLGKLSERQVDQVRVEMQRRVRILAVLLAVGPAVATGVVIALVRAGGGDLGVGIGEAFGIAYVIMLVFVLPTMAFAVVGNYLRPIRNRTTGSVTGRIKLTERGEDVHLQLGRVLTGPRFAIGPEQAAGLVDGDRYTIYFTPGGKRAVFHSIEAAPKARADDDEAGSDDTETDEAETDEAGEST